MGNSSMVKSITRSQPNRACFPLNSGGRRADVTEEGWSQTIVASPVGSSCKKNPCDLVATAKSMNNYFV